MHRDSGRDADPTTMTNAAGQAARAAAGAASDRERPGAPVVTHDNLVCVACGNISGGERGGVVVCRHCGYTQERRAFTQN